MESKPLWQKALEEAKRQQKPREWLEKACKDIANEVLTPEELNKVLSDVEEHRGTGASVQQFTSVLDKDQRGKSLARFSLSPDSDLAGVDFYGTDLTRTEFHHVDMSKAKLSRIIIDGEWIDLEEGSIEVPEAKPWTLEPSGAYVGNCDDCEIYNNRVMNKASPGIFFFWHDKPIGYVKLKGERSFLALRTVHAPQGTLFWKGMVYALDGRLITWLESKAKEVAPFQEEEKPWYAASIEDITASFLKPGGHAQHPSYLWRDNMRFLHNSVYFKKLDELRAKLDAEGGSLTHLRPDRRFAQ